MNERNIYIFKNIFVILFTLHFVLHNNYWNKIVNIPDIKKIYRAIKYML